MFTWLVGSLCILFVYQVLYVQVLYVQIEHQVWTIQSLILSLLIPLSIHFRTYIVHCIGLFILCKYVSHVT